MRRPLMIRGGRVLRFGAAAPEFLDIEIGSDGRIAEIGPSLPEGDAETLAVDGQLVLPGLVDMHQHLDKSRTRALLDNPSGTLLGASAAYRALAPSITKEQMIARARRTVEACSAHGTVAIRSHTNIDPQTGVRGIEAMVELRAQCAAFMHIQIVGHVTSGATSMLPESDAWLRQAIDLGIDAIGGVPAFSSEPIALLKLLFDSSERSGLPLDMHIDEHLDPARAMFSEIARMTRAYGMAGRVVAGHSSALSAMAPDEAQRTIEELREAGVGIVTLPAAKSFLQGRDADRLPPRGLTRVKELLAAGIPVAAASDNIQDPFRSLRLRRSSGDCQMDVAGRATRYVRPAPGLRDGQFGAGADDRSWRRLGHQAGCASRFADRACGNDRRSRRRRCAGANGDGRGAGGLFDGDAEPSIHAGMKSGWRVSMRYG